MVPVIREAIHMVPAEYISVGGLCNRILHRNFLEECNHSARKKLFLGDAVASETIARVFYRTLARVFYRTDIRNLREF